MQGKNGYEEKLFSQFQLSERIPESNFFRRLKSELDLNFLYSLTKVTTTTLKNYHKSPKWNTQLKE